ncbi:dTDP-4-dehydrorhamnose 3,5-epimerase family protein [Vibrio neptunius]|uniref:dTDP-4-dehydrorhamnose 3,5-epimerase family protein n=1 Tax=Vibrio neptunius TaxID=170651 RepID=UPI001C5C94CB|nr:dTDP-4-dehydrorhamnose 3,5-epimerase family protein [Vibrio neptunius]QXX06782.1 dTDP-4-dehydrorhamnose 3,5-epimerase family protein [Vibrio neptunius]
MGFLEGVCVEPLRIIKHDKGDILHALKENDSVYSGFGEVYFSTVHHGEVKGWKKHTTMNMNLVVPEGEVRIVVYDDRESSSTRGQFLVAQLSRNNYSRVTVQAGLWVAFQGVSRTTNLLMNFADIKHDPSESISMPLDSIQFDWSLHEEHSPI